MKCVSSGGDFFGLAPANNENYRVLLKIVYEIPNFHQVGHEEEVSFCKQFG